MRRSLPIAVLLLAAWFAIAAGVAHADAVDDEARAIGREVQCPVCQGLSVADSPSQLAAQMRGIIRTKLDAGESREAILAYFVDRIRPVVDDLGIRISLHPHDPAVPLSRLAWNRRDAGPFWFHYTTRFAADRIVASEAYRVGDRARPGLYVTTIMPGEA